MKIKLTPMAVLPAMPLTLVATEKGGQVNFAPHGQCATFSGTPPVLSLSVMKGHLTTENILATGRFSVNIPPAEMLEQVKHCGAVSGKEEGKAASFAVFYGEAATPMVAGCPLSMACKVVHTAEFADSILVLAQVVETFADEACIENETLLPANTRPLLCGIGGKFWHLGEEV